MSDELSSPTPASLARSAKDTGSPEFQVAQFSQRIRQIADHLQTHAKDNAARHGLLALVGRRRKLLTYLKRRDAQKHQALIKRLGLRG